MRTVDLPSTSAGTRSAADLSADAAAVRKVLDEVGAETVVCGHSYGGMVISHEAVGTHPRVRHLIYLCAFVPDPGQSLQAVGGGALAPWIRIDEQRMTLPDLTQAAALFYGDCDSDTQKWAVSHLQSQPVACFTESIGTPSWKTIPSTYAVCNEDAGLPPQLQRDVFAPRTGATRELAAGHSPFLSQPQALADLMIGIMQK